MPRENRSFKRVMKNLNKEVKQIKGKTMAGLVSAAAVVRHDMDRTPPLIPVDTGNLRQSWFITRVHGKNPGLVLGFSANYAVFVHENIGASFKRPHAGAKFFESSLNDNQKEILNAIKEETKL